MTERLIRHVTVDGRKFVVDLDGDGKPLSIKERKLHAPGEPWECWKNASYWHHSMKLGGENTLPRRIIAAAKGQTP